MGRTVSEIEDTQMIIEDDPQGLVGKTMTAINLQAAADQTSNDNARAIATQLGYDSTLTVGALEDEIRFYQRRTVEACFELGKRLLILKELTPHGEFKQRVELLDIEYTTATRFMLATIKFSKVGSNQLLKAAKTQTKMLELLVLDDGEISALEEGETVRGLKLDDIEYMSVSELKKALRKTKADLEATDAVIKKKDDKLNELDRELEAKKHERAQKIEESAMPGDYELSRLQEYARGLTVNISATLNSEIMKLFDQFGDEPPQHIRLACAQTLGLIQSATQQVALNTGLTPITDANTASAADEVWALVEADLNGHAQ